MRCPRCGGLMNFEYFTNAVSGEMPWSYEGWRCVYCGEVIDPLILLNRMKEAKNLEEEEEGATAGARQG